MKEWRQDTWMTLLSRIPVMLLSFLSITLLTRWLGPEGNGVYTFVLANINLFLLAFGLQSETATLHYLSKRDSNKDDLISLSLFSTSVSSILFALFLLLTGFLVPSFHSLLVPSGQPYRYFIWFIVLSFLFKKTQNNVLAIQRASLKFKAYNTYQISAQLIPVILYGYGFFILDVSKQAILTIPVFNFILISQAFISVLGLWHVFSSENFTLSFRFKDLLKPFYLYSLKSTLDAIAKFINRRIDVYFIQAFKGVNTLGQYGLATQITNFAQEIILPFTQVMNPYMVKSDEPDRIGIATRMARIILIITLFISISILVTAPFVIPLLFGKVFRPSVLATQILSFSVVLSTLRLVFASYFQAVNQLNFNIQSNWLGVGMTIFLDILLIPSYGIVGAAWASIIAYMTSLLLLFFHFTNQTKTKWKDILLIQKNDFRWLFNQTKNEDRK